MKVVNIVKIVISLSFHKVATEMSKKKQLCISNLIYLFQPKKVGGTLSMTQQALLLNIYIYGEITKRRREEPKWTIFLMTLRT